MNTWKKRLREAGFPRMDYIERISEGIRTDANGGKYMAVTAYLRKGKYRAECVVDIALLDMHPHPVDCLWGEIAVVMHEMDAAADRGAAVIGKK